jgi:hypothetical protein
MDDGADQRTHPHHRHPQPLPRLSLPPNPPNGLPTPTSTTQRPLSAATASHPHYIQQSLASQVGYSSYPPQNPFVPLAPGPGPNDARGAAAAQNLKRKRSSEHHITRHTSEDGSGSDQSYPHTQISSAASTTKQQQLQQQQLHAADLKKRTKTQRACDKCRTKKIRCSRSRPPSSSSPAHFSVISRCDVLPDEDPPRCAHCKQYNYDCTFFLPITETRFKKRRTEEENQAAQAANRCGENQSPAGADKRNEGSNGEVRIYGVSSSLALRTASVSDLRICSSRRADFTPLFAPFYGQSALTYSRSGERL